MRRVLFGLLAFAVAVLPAHADLIINPYAHKFSATFLQISAEEAHNAGDVTFSSQNFGPVADSRRLYAVIHTRGTAGVTLTGLTIGGVTASIHSQACRTFVGGDQCVSISSAAVPTGTSGDVVETWSGTGPGRSYVALYRVLGQTGAVDDADNTTAADTLTIAHTLTTVVGGAAIVAITDADGGTDNDSNTWTNATEKYDAELTSHGSSHLGGALATGITGTSVTITATWNGPSATNISSMASVAFH
jgi:hypothetical protein